MSSPDDIVGLKTIDTGEIDSATGFPRFRHEPLTRAEADAIRAQSDADDKRRQEQMPDEQSAINHMWDGWYRLKDFGWREAIYCPKDGTHFQAIEAGSTGIHDCNYQGEWPNGSWWLYDGDIWPSRPILFKLYPEDQVKEDARCEEARKRFAAFREVDNITVPKEPKVINTTELVARLRKCANRISRNTSEKDSEWEEIGLMRDAADVIERLAY